MSVLDRVHDIVAPLCTDAGVELFDLQHNGGVLRVSIDREGGVDMEVIRALTKAVSRALDEADPIATRYTLEVSSPGLERTLRTPVHFRWAVDQIVKIKTRPEVDGDRRLQGLLVVADDDGIEIEDQESGETRRLAYDDIDKARTVFEWGPAPKPGSPQQKSRKRKASS